jgi:hypothetical protein
MTRLFSKKRVHPIPPILDPKVAPWSASRHYTTSIKEEADALKAAARAGKPTVKVVGTKGFLRNPGRAKTRTPNCFDAVSAHLREIYQQIAANFKVNSQQLVAKLFCIRIDVD